MTICLGEVTQFGNLGLLQSGLPIVAFLAEHLQIIQGGSSASVDRNKVVDNPGLRGSSEFKPLAATLALPGRPFEYHKPRSPRRNYATSEVFIRILPNAMEAVRPHPVTLQQQSMIFAEWKSGIGGILGKSNLVYRLSVVGGHVRVELSPTPNPRALNRHASKERGASAGAECMRRSGMRRKSNLPLSTGSTSHFNFLGYSKTTLPRAVKVFRAFQQMWLAINGVSAGKAFYVWQGNLRALIYGLQAGG